MHTHAHIEENAACPLPFRGTVSIPLRSCCFSEAERLALLRAPGLGPVVVGRLEAQGLASFQALRQVGAERVVQMICEAVGSKAWKNRRAALERVLEPPDQPLTQPYLTASMLTGPADLK